MASTQELIDQAVNGLGWLESHSGAVPITELKIRRSTARAAAYQAFIEAADSATGARAHDLLTRIDQF
jgi:hypothetical protein